jgi:cytochrome b561
MDYAKELARSNLQYVGDRNRMPIYPGLMSFFYRSEMSNKEYFQLGKEIGVAIALLVSLESFVLFRRVSTDLDAFVATLVAMFTVLAYKAAYFQAEVLFYGINLLLFYLLHSLIRKPQIGTAVLAGITAGIGHLTKASILPALLLAGLLVILRGTDILWHTNQASKSQLTPSDKARHLLTHLGYTAILLICFLVIVSPYIRTSKERFGHYFYNVNSTFYIWYDSWQEVESGTKAHGDRQGWPDMPEEQIPSFQKYLQEHSTRQITERFFQGLLTLWERVTHSYGYAEFLLFYLIAIMLFFGQNWAQTWSILRGVNPWVILFVLGYFLGYLMLYAWYTPIADGNRFVLALFLPGMLVIQSLLSAAQSNDLQFTFGERRIPATAISPFIFLFLIAYLLTIFPDRVSTMFGGS